MELYDEPAQEDDTRRMEMLLAERDLEEELWHTYCCNKAVNKGEERAKQP